MKSWGGGRTLDYVCSRALGEFSVFLDWARSATDSSQTSYTLDWRRDLEEIQKIQTWDWSEPIEVPHSLRRLLLVGHKEILNYRRMP